ncbi:unnamed protein product, partial [Staurois parvus]
HCFPALNSLPAPGDRCCGKLTGERTVCCFVFLCTAEKYKTACLQGKNTYSTHSKTHTAHSGPFDHPRC